MDKVERIGYRPIMHVHIPGTTMFIENKLSMHWPISKKEKRKNLFHGAT